MSVVRHLLPGNVVPVHYDLEFCPDLDRLVYSGAAVIDVVVTEDDTKTVSLHSKELHLHSASFKSGEKDLKMTAISYNVAATEVTITFDESLPKGNGKLDIKFSGILNGDMAGFYRSAYVDAQGKKKFMATTQFEAIDARRAFPCWDEPAHKCTFDISLVIPVELTGVSNMPEKEVVYLNAGYEHMSPYSYSNPTPSKTSLKRIRFFTSPKMSTYLVAFCVGEFDSVSKVSRDNVNVRILCPPGRAKECNFSLDIAIKSLEFYNDFFQVPYPLPKLDMICITEFAMGAMENWGLVTYRETALMIDDEKASSQSKQRVAIVVAHELAHQWFGNLVTMAWWDGLWLNEGFAAFMEHFCIASVCPEYRIWDQFTTDALGAALRLDSLRSSHPVIVPIKHAEEVEQVFDAISYCKGSCVVNMVYSTLGADHFQAGLRNYFKKYAYQNTETPDLWREWSEVSGVDVAALMSTWTQVMGYPVVDVVSESWSENSVSVTLRQQWFLADGSLKSDESQPQWTIPLLFATKSSVSDKAVLMTEKVQAFTIPIEGSDDFVKINAGQKALIRVKHSMGMLQRLKPQLGLAQSALSDVDKASLLLDAYALVKAQLSSIDDLVFLLKGCNPQTNSLVLWNAYQAIFGALNLFFDEIQGSAKAHFDKFAKQFVKKGLDFIGWNSLPTDGHTDRLVRSAVIGLLDVFCWDEAGIVEECRRRFAALLRGEKHEVPAEYKTTLFKIVLMNGGVKEYEQILETFTSTEDNQEKKYALFSLGSSLKPELKLRTLDWAIKTDQVKLQDFFYPIGAVANNKEGAELCWKYYKDNFSAVRGRLGKSSPSLMDAVIVNCTSRFCSEAAAQDIEAFFEKNPLPSNTRKIAQVLENMRANAKLVETIAASANLQSESAWF